MSNLPQTIGTLLGGVVTISLADLALRKTSQLADLGDLKDKKDLDINLNKDINDIP